ncbi:MAG: RnfH family protein [Oxalobacter sp.]|nr:MAG: RnfH family protein [Oxalobacter sp.]
MADLIGVLVAYATPETQCLREVRVPNGTTLRQALMHSSLLQEFPEIDLQQNRVGVYGKLRDLDAMVCEHDRIEIYRSLMADPREARRRRAAKK